MKAVSFNAYRKLTKLAKEDAATLAAARRDGLATIAASGRKLIVREDAIGAYCDARRNAQETARRLAEAHPEKAPSWSPNARRRARWS